jgi:galacturonosyltransferase
MDRCPQILRELGCHIIDLPLERRGTNPIQDWKLLRRYRTLLKEIRPDVVLTYTVKANVYGGWACCRTKTPYLANVTGLGDAIEHPGLLRKLVLALYRLGLRRANCVFFQNASNREFFLKQGAIGKKVPTCLLPGSGVNLKVHCPEVYPHEDNELRFLFIGRVMRDKGVEELFEAIEKIIKNNIEVRFRFLGDCDAAYRDRLDALCATGKVEYLGFRNEIHSIIADSHCIVLPSYHEGTANSLLEAAATGRPVIATNVPGCRETFDDGVSGLGCEVKSADSLYEQILRFLSLSHEEREAMGKAGRRKMEKEFDRQIVIDAYLEEINRIFSEKKG